MSDNATDETTDTATDHDIATCEQPELLRLTITRGTDTEPGEGDGPITEAAVSVEVQMHMHTEAELRSVVNVLQETQARIEAHLLLTRLRVAMPSDLLAEMLDALGEIVVVQLDTEAGE